MTVDYELGDVSSYNLQDVSDDLYEIRQVTIHNEVEVRNDNGLCGWCKNHYKGILLFLIILFMIIGAVIMMLISNK